MPSLGCVNCLGKCTSCVTGIAGGLGIGMLAERTGVNPNVYELPFSGGTIATGLGKLGELNIGGLALIVIGLSVLGAFGDIKRFGR